MLTKKMTVKIPNGLEARPVAVLVQKASCYESSVYVECEDKKVNAKSIMGMMSLGIAAGEEVTIIVDGPDEEKAVQDIASFLNGEK